MITKIFKIDFSRKSLFTFSLYNSGSQSGLYRPPGVYDNFQGVYDSVKKIWGSMKQKWGSMIVDPNVDSSLLKHQVHPSH